jgi:hypothetical protein
MHSSMTTKTTFIQIKAINPKNRFYSFNIELYIKQALGDL